MEFNMYEELKEKYPEIHIGKAINLCDEYFGRWHVLYRTLNRDNKKTRWVCQCSCGTIRVIDASYLLRGKSKSCGCLRKQHKIENDENKMRVRDDNNNIIKKKCFRCNRMLPISQFHKSASQYDGYSGECKQCEVENEANRYNVYKKGAKARNLVFSVTREEFHNITSKPCHYCGGYSKQDINGISYNGIDRVDSSNGYVSNNIVPCCAVCNRMKLDYPLDDFFKHINKIIDFQKEIC